MMHIHWHKLIWQSKNWRFFECRCGKRRADFRFKYGYSAYPQWWIDGHDSPPPLPVPRTMR